MSKMTEKFKENKKIMMIKMEQASKMADDAAEEFVKSIESLVKDASEEQLKEFLGEKDEMIDLDDKMAVVAAFADSHTVGNITIIGVGI